MGTYWAAPPPHTPPPPEWPRKHGARGSLPHRLVEWSVLNNFRVEVAPFTGAGVNKWRYIRKMIGL